MRSQERNDQMGKAGRRIGKERNVLIGCKKMIVAKGMKIYCPEHTEVRRKEHLKRGWDKQNEKRRKLRLSIKEKS